MAETSLARGLVICSDEIHCDLIYPPHRHLPLASLDPEIARRTVTLMAPSKTFNIPGLGFSFAVIEDAGLRKQYKAAARDIVPHINALGYTAALAAYTEGEPWLAACIEYLQANRDFLAQFVQERLPGVRMALPEATYLAWLDFSGLNLGEDPHKFFLREARVALNEAAPFGPGSAGFARLNFGCPRSLLLEALERMEAAVTDSKEMRTAGGPCGDARESAIGGSLPCERLSFDTPAASCYTRSRSGLRASLLGGDPRRRPRRDGRAVDGGGLENRCGASHRGFESLSLRQCPGLSPWRIGGGRIVRSSAPAC